MANAVTTNPKQEVMSKKTNLTKHAQGFRSLADQIIALRKRQKDVVEVLRSFGAGRYDGATVYEVKGHQVRAHYRNGYTAVRVNRRATLE